MSLIGMDYRKDKKILELKEKARKLEISPGEAEDGIRQRLGEYFPRNNFTDVFAKISALEKLTEGFFSSGGGMATPLNERYAQKHGLSGRLSPETVFCPPEERNYGSAVKGLKENINEPP
jgi:hypothetical protein